MTVKRNLRGINAVILACTGLAACLYAGEKGADPSTVPMALDHNRMTVMLELQKPDGSWRSARAWVDTGGTTVLVGEALAGELGVDLAALPAGGGQTAATKIAVPALRLGGVLLDSEGLTLSVRRGRVAMPGIAADCVLPPRCLRRLHVVFDYPARKLTVARPGALAPLGAAVPCRVNPETGLFLVEATIAGEKTALGVDTGSAGTWVSDKLTAAWQARDPDSPRATGAAGSTNFFGFPFETKGVLMRMPSSKIGPVPVAGEVAVLGLDPELFDWYSRKSAAAVAGFLGADLLARFRLEVDFPGQMTWWQAGPPPATRDLDVVPLTLRSEADGSYFVAGVVERDGEPLAAGVQAGDKLLAVDGRPVTGLAMGTVVRALRGRPGDTRVLRLERQGRELSVRATVVRLP